MKQWDKRTMNCVQANVESDFQNKMEDNVIWLSSSVG